MSRCYLVALLAFFAAACESPEAQRTRGGGPGADTGNRSEIVRMHEGSSQFYRTPQLAPGKGAPIEPSEHAREFSG